jgi:hypothetical protein
LFIDSQLLKKVESMIVGGFNESHAMLKKCIDETKVTFLPPYNHKLINSDQTKAADQRRLIDGLPNVGDAAVHSYEDRAKVRCLEGTQVNALEQIQVWVEGVQAPSIFWLNGQAGTGKSTISRTVAHEGFSRKHCADKSPLPEDTHFVASFFFDYKQPDRRNAQRLFTTLSRSLAQKLPDIEGYISDAIESNRDIATANPTFQWHHLIRGPLTNLDNDIGAPVRLNIVMDALDECEDQSDLDRIFRLLGHLKHLKTAQLRVFVTSRPEARIRAGFDSLIREDLVRKYNLNKVPVSASSPGTIDDITR